MMKHYYPAYYKNFRCIAAGCPDSCCQGWDVVIDETAEAFYDTVEGGFGARLRSAIYTDGDGDRVFRLAQEKKCPFWDTDRLCEIYKTLGEERLCETCALFPRLRMEFADFTEHSLALACPEAARLILSTDSAYAGFTHTEAQACEDYDSGVMELLLQARRHSAALLTQAKPLRERLRDCLRYHCSVQQQLRPEVKADLPRPDALSELFGQLEYIDEANRGSFIRACGTEPDFTGREREFTNLAMYWLYRYFLGAVDTLNVTAPVLHIIASLSVVAGLVQNEGLSPAEAAQRYSKEVEQSYENMERIWTFYET